MSTAYDPFRILHQLDEHRVRYVVIGGLAVQAHGHPRTTQDIDVIVAVDSDNAHALSSALQALGAQLRGVDADLAGIDPLDPDVLATGANFTLTTDHGWLDLFAPDLVPGAPSFQELQDDALEVELRGLHVPVASLQHLFAMKRAAGRPHDLTDVEALEQIQALAADD